MSILLTDSIIQSLESLTALLSIDPDSKWTQLISPASIDPIPASVDPIPASVDPMLLPYDPESNWVITLQHRTIYSSFPPLLYKPSRSYSQRRYPLFYLLD